MTHIELYNFLKWHKKQVIHFQTRNLPRVKTLAMQDFVSTDIELFFYHLSTICHSISTTAVATLNHWSNM